MLDANIEWLEDTALKLLCVFALDRFGDFVSDEVKIYFILPEVKMKPLQWQILVSSISERSFHFH